MDSREFTKDEHNNYIHIPCGENVGGKVNMGGHVCAKEVHAATTGNQRDSRPVAKDEAQEG